MFHTNVVHYHRFVQRGIKFIFADAKIPDFSGSEFDHVRRVAEIFYFAFVHYHNLIARAGNILGDVRGKNHHAVAAEFYKKQILLLTFLFFLKDSL